MLGHEAGDPRARSEPGIKLAVSEQNGVDGVLGGVGKGKRFGFGWFGVFPAPLRHASAFGLPPSQLPSVINEVPPLALSLCRGLQLFWCSPELRGVDTGQVVPRARFGLPFCLLPFWDGSS